MERPAAKKEQEYRAGENRITAMNGRPFDLLWVLRISVLTPNYCESLHRNPWSIFAAEHLHGDCMAVFSEL